MGKVVKKEKYVIRKPTLRAREQFLRVEKEYQSVLQKAEIDPAQILKLLTSEELKEVSQTGEVPRSVWERLSGEQAILEAVARKLTTDEELEYTQALFELAKACIDWSESEANPEDLLDEPMEEVVRIISSFRFKIGRR